MQLSGRRISTNVDDRRRSGGSGRASLGIGTVVVVGIIVWLMGGDPSEVLQSVNTNQMPQTTSVAYEPTQAEENMATFAKQILAGTEDVWTEQFKNMGRTYVPPKLVLFHSSVQSGCGGASASSGPFYCSADQCVYLDLSFFEQMEKSLKAGGDFAYAYVIAHEVGHHVQYLLGILQQADEQMAQLNEAESNKISVRLELQADFFAGVWAYHDNKKFGSLEDGDVDEGLNAASKIGDDYLQKQAQGYAVPESFNHGTSAQRSRWLKKGLSTGNINNGDTFGVDYADL